MVCSFSRVVSAQNGQTTRYMAFYYFRSKVLARGSLPPISLDIWDSVIRPQCVRAQVVTSLGVLGVNRNANQGPVPQPRACVHTACTPHGHRDEMAAREQRRGWRQRGPERSRPLGQCEGKRRDNLRGLLSVSPGAQQGCVGTVQLMGACAGWLPGWTRGSVLWWR